MKETETLMALQPNTRPEIDRKYNPAIEVEDMTFGVEIETHIPTSANVPVRSYHSYEPLPSGWLPPFVDEYGDYKEWQATQDSSICTPNYQREDCEFISPVLKGVAGLQNVMDVARVIKAPLGSTIEIDGVTYKGLGAGVNRSCGIHIHVGFNYERPISDVQKLVHLVGAYEPGLYAATGTKARERGTYSQPLKAGWHRREPREVDSMADQRYLSLNMSALLNRRRPAVEFRTFAGSKNPQKIATYIMLCLGIVQQAVSMPRAPKWDLPAATDTYGPGKGQGHKELNRLIRKIGWVLRGAQFGPCGMMQGRGIPTLKKAIKLLRELADKYDAQP